MDQPIHDGDHRMLGGKILIFFGFIPIVVINTTRALLTSKNPDT